MMKPSENETKMAEAVLRHFIETGRASSREDIAASCGVSPSTVGKWLKECHGLPNGCSYELRSRRGGGGGPGKEFFYPRIGALREIILEERGINPE
jgi:hypothetical protein